MKVLAAVTVFVHKYFELSMEWKGHQSFDSSISIKHSNVEKATRSLNTGLVESGGYKLSLVASIMTS